MEQLEEYLSYQPQESQLNLTAKVNVKDDKLKGLSKKLKQTYRSEPKAAAYLDEYIAEKLEETLLHSNKQYWSITDSNKILFLWDAFPSIRHETTTDLMLRIAVQSLQYYWNCPHHKVTDYTLMQRLITVVVSVCQHTMSDFFNSRGDLMEELSTLLLDFCFTETGSIELSSLAGTAILLVYNVMGLDLMEKYHSLYKNYYNSPEQKGFGFIAITAGLLNSVKYLPEATRQSSITGSLILSNVITLCKAGINDYHAFQCFQLFTRSSFMDVLLAQDYDELVERMMQVIWAHVDSPVEGVSEFIVTTFQSLLQAALRVSADSFSTLIQQLLDKLLLMPWTVKGKLRLLSVLMTWVDMSQLLDKNPFFVSGLSQCLGTQYLASVCGKLYSTIISRLTKHAWLIQILKPFIAAINTNNKLLRYNLCVYWLPTTIERFPGVERELIQELSSPDHYNLAAIISVVRECRKRSHTITHIPSKVLSRARLEAEDDVRADYISLICTGYKTAGNKATGLITVEEKTQVEDFLPDNLNISCPSFRHKLMSSMNSWMTRLFYSLKHFQNKESDVHVYLMKNGLIMHFEWLLTLVQNNLLIGSNYQRKETTLKLIQILLNSVHSAALAESCELHISEVVELWRSYQPALLRSVVTVTLVDCSSEIQELSYQLLRDSFTTSSAIQTSPDDVMKLIKSDLDVFISSPKASVAESGALKSALIVELGDSFEASDLVLTDIIPVIESTVSSIAADKYSLSTAKHIYGRLVALSHILTRTNFLSANQNVKEMGHRIIAACGTAVQTTLEILSSRTPHAGSSPSFEEMERAIDDLVQRAGGGDRQVAADTHEKLSAWCWLTLKESCSLCGQIALISKQYPQLMDYTDALNIKEMFIATLTRCRHRGVLEGSIEGFMSFCYSMFTRTDADFQSISQDSADMVLQAVSEEDKNIKSTSVTRRSAGYPIIMQCILAAELKAKKTVLFHEVLVKLISVCEKLDYSNQSDDKVDLPQVHCLNILKALVVESKLASAIRQYLSRIAEICINSFNSPIWAIRNAATQLFASTTQRMIGQKRQADGSIVSTSCLEFFTVNSSLYNFFLHKLQTSDSARLQPYIFPILSLIGSLTPCTLSIQKTTDELSMEPFRTELYKYLANPILVVRRLAAQALLSTLDSQINRNDYKHSLLTKINESKSANEKHGMLLLLVLLLQTSSDYLNRETSAAAYLSISHSLYNQAKAFLTSNACPLIISLYLDCLLLAFDASSSAAGDIPSLIQVLDNIVNGRHMQVPGWSQMQLSAAQLLVRLAGDDHVISLLMCVRDSEVRTEIIKYLLKKENLPVHNLHQLQVSLFDDLDSSRSLASLELYMNFLEVYPTVADANQIVKSLDIISHMSGRSSKVNTCDAILRCHVGRSDWKSLLNMAKPTAEEEERAAVCRSVSLLVTSGSLQMMDKDKLKCCLTCLHTLLQDESMEIREYASLSTTYLVKSFLLNHSDNCNEQCKETNHSSSDQVINSTCLHHNAAQRLILEVVPFLAGLGADDWLVWLNSLIDDLLMEVHDRGSIAGSDQMFFQEEVNVYSEKTVCCKQLLNAIHRLRRTTLAALSLPSDPGASSKATDSGKLCNQALAKLYDEMRTVVHNIEISESLLMIDDPGLLQSHVRLYTGLVYSYRFGYPIFLADGVDSV